MVKDSELRHLRRCVELAVEALENGDEPFGSVLVAADGTVPAEDRNRVAGGDHTRHPEFELARWSAAHARVGLGRIVYVASSAQLTAWSAESGAPQAPVRPLPVQEVAPGVAVEGPVPELVDEVRELHRRRLRS
ncbi:nucleoside deaminase [Streptomyces sp. NPDC004232]|uniref:nucleoside deaminase n=1 Tax=Streptomyces sp. NPDC004232 TaxID=3154454 RepID=UPI001D941977|nr:nucleoside deaminase [Streptomyces sp. tea 10]